MIGNFKTLGLALMAVFAFGAVAATAASAQQGKLTSDGSVTLILAETAGTVNAITAFGAKVECPNSILTLHKTLTTKETEEGKKHELIPSGSTSATITPDYVQANCKAVEGGTTHKMTLTMNGCDYDLRIGTTIGAGPSYGLTTDIVCPTGKDIETEVFAFAGSELGGIACTVTIKPQVNIGGATAKTNVASDDIEVSGTWTGITASRSGFGCATEETKTAEFDLNATVTGKNAGGGATGVTLSD